jgi:hypothetical protein
MNAFFFWSAVLENHIFHLHLMCFFCSSAVSSTGLLRSYFFFASATSAANRLSYWV